MKKKELKTIDIHADYVLHTMVSVARQAIGVLCSYMQNNTEYNDAYQAAFKQYKKTMNEFDKFVSTLQETVETRKEGNDND